MPIDSPHPAYLAHIDLWRMIRCAYDGEHAVKAAGEAYLPKIDPGQTSEEYAAYKRRALYYEAVGRTVDGFVGAMTRKEHVFTWPAKAEEVFEHDATADGTGIAEFIKRLAIETLLMARGGILVDYDETLARSYVTAYQAEAIISWSAAEVRLQECVYERDPKDEFRIVEVQQIRQLHLVDGRYTVTIWRRASGANLDQRWVVHSQATPTRRGKPFNALPFFWLSTLGQTSRIAKPPLLGLVNVAMSHYRSSADLEHGRHFAGLPTLWVTGASADEPIRVGAATAIVLSEPAAKVGYAEFTGQGLGSLENALESKERQMATLGAAIFAEAKKGVEAAETARIRTSAENSLLMGVVSAVEESLEAALRCAAEWMGIAGEIDIAVNRDFVDSTIDPATLAALVKALQAGAISLETFLFNLGQGEMLPPETDIEEEAAKLRADAERRAEREAAQQVRPAAGQDTGGVE